MYLKNTYTTSSLSVVLPLDLHLSAQFINAAEGTPTVEVCVVADNPQDIAGRSISVTISATADSAQG